MKTLEDEVSDILTETLQRFEESEKRARRERRRSLQSCQQCGAPMMRTSPHFVVCTNCPDAKLIPLAK